MKVDKKPNGGERFLVRWLNLPPIAAEALEDQRIYRKGVRRQKLRLPGWIGALLLLSGIVIPTAQQVQLLSDSRWWSVLGFGLFLTGTLTISFAAHLGYWREQISQQDNSRDSSE